MKSGIYLKTVKIGIKHSVWKYWRTLV